MCTEIKFGEDGDVDDPMAVGAAVVIHVWLNAIQSRTGPLRIPRCAMNGSLNPGSELPVRNDTSGGAPTRDHCFLLFSFTDRALSAATEWGLHFTLTLERPGKSVYRTVPS